MEVSASVKIGLRQTEVAIYRVRNPARNLSSKQGKSSFVHADFLW